MAITALTLGGLSLPAGVLPSADQLTSVVSGTGGNVASTLVGTTVGYGPVYSQGNTGAWPGLLAPSSPGGHGVIWDSVTLEQQQIVGGAWSISSLLSVSSGTLVADLVSRVYLYSAGVYVLVGTVTLPAQTLTTTPTVYTLAGVLQAVAVAAGQKLYADLWANVTVNPRLDPAMTINWGDFQSVAPASAQCSWVTPGYQPLSSAQQIARYQYGAFVIHDGINYLTQQKDFDYPTVQETMYKIARFEGMKKTGETVNDKTIAVTIRILGTSRYDVEAKLDALFQGLAQRQQALSLHALDGRYWVCDAITGKAHFQPGTVVSVEVPVSFQASQPFALAAGPSSFTLPDTVLGAGTGGATSWASGPVVFAGGGTYFNRPIITVTNDTPANNNVLGASLVNGTPYTSLTIAAPGLAHAVTSGQKFLLNDGAGHTQTVTASAAAAAAATTLAVTSFTANFSYPLTTTTVNLDTSVTTLTLVQATDGQTLTLSGLVGFTHGQSILVTCDPLAANGYTALLNGAGNPLAFQGVFPVLEPGATSWQVLATANNQPTLMAAWTWNARWIS